MAKRKRSSKKEAQAAQEPLRLRKRQLGWTALVVGLLGMLAVAGWPFVRAHLQAVAVLDQVSNKPVPAIVGNIVAEPITVEDLSFEVPSGKVRARVYLPTDKPDAPAMIVLHGVHHLGIDEPRLESFAAAMASCGLRVLTPELPDIKDYHVDQKSVETIGESVEWYAKKTGGPVGVMGLSFSGGLALVAAADPQYEKNFKFVFAVGSQDRMERVARYFRTGADVRPDGTIERLPAHEYGPLVLEYEYIEDFVPPADVEAVRTVLRAHLYEDKTAEAAAKARLNEAQKSEATAMMDASSAATQARLEQATEKHGKEMEALSPGDRLKQLKTPVYLLHGEGDNIIPAAETLWMARELPPTSLRAVLVSPELSHIDVAASPASPGLWEQWKLVHLLALVMHEAESR